MSDFQRDPAFGRDPWLGPISPPDPSVHEQLAASVRYSGADTIGGDIGLLPTGLNAYMSYVDNFGGYPELVNRFGGSGAHLVSITIFGGQARCADMEPGAMQIGDFPHWYDNVAIHDEFMTWGYTSASNMQSLIDVAGSRQFLRWSAHYGFGPHICGPSTCGYPQAHWTQWDDKGPNGENYDRSIGLVLPTPNPPPPPPKDTEMISSTRNADGRLELFAIDKTGQVWHTWQEAVGKHWVGENPTGGGTAEWFKLATPIAV